MSKGRWADYAVEEAPVTSRYSRQKKVQQADRPTKMTVEMDAQVFLRISKHARENFPASVSGSLLGLDVDGADEALLRVTSCFAYKMRKEDPTEASSKDFTEYQYEVLRHLAEVRQDANAIGWYESTHHGNFLNEGFVESQYMFQKTVPNAVVIVYDPFRQKIGKCGFKAYRLTQKAMRHKEMHEEEEDCFQNFPSEDLLEEVPITLYCSPFVETFLLQWQSSNFETFDMDNMTPALERNVQLLLESLDEFSLQQREMQQYERQTRQAKDKIAKNQRVPKSIDTLNLSKQIQEHCKHLDNFSQDAFSKLYLVNAKKDDEIAEVITTLGTA